MSTPAALVAAMPVGAAVVYKRQPPPMARREPTAPARRRPAARRTAAEPEARQRMANDERRAQLLALGVEMFSKHPWHEVQIDDVARAAGISKGLLYHYFPTKKHFYAEVIREAARRLLATTDMPPTMVPLERLTAGLTRYLDFVEQRADAYVTLLRGNIGADPGLAGIVEDTRRQLLARIFEGVGMREPPPRLRLVMRGWLGFVEATSIDWLERRDLARDDVLALWTDALLALVPGGLAASSR